MPAMVPYTSSSDSIFDQMNNFWKGSYNSARNLITNAFRIDIREDDDNYTIEAELPGVKKDEVTVTIDQGKLVIAVNRVEAEEEPEDKGNYIHRERKFTSMSREVYLPESNDKQVAAKMADGILTITVPKVEKIDTSTHVAIG